MPLAWLPKNVVLVTIWQRISHGFEWASGENILHLSESIILYICIFGLVQICASLLHANLAMFRFVRFCQPNLDVQSLQQLHEGFNPRFLQHQEGNKCDCMQTFRGFMRNFKASKLWLKAWTLGGGCLRKRLISGHVALISCATWRFARSMNSSKGPKMAKTEKKWRGVYSTLPQWDCSWTASHTWTHFEEVVCLCPTSEGSVSIEKFQVPKSFSTYWVVGSNFNSPPSSSMAPSSQIVNNDVNGSKVSPTSKYRRIPKHSNLEALRPEFSCQRSQVLQGLANLIITLGVQAFLGLAEKPNEKKKRQKELLRISPPCKTTLHEIESLPGDECLEALVLEGPWDIYIYIYIYYICE